MIVWTLGAAGLGVWTFVSPSLVLAVLLCVRLLMDNYIARNEAVWMSGGLAVAIGLVSAAWLLTTALRDGRHPPSVRRALVMLLAALALGTVQCILLDRLNVTVWSELLLWVVLLLLASAAKNMDPQQARKFITIVTIPAAFLIVFPGETFLEGSFEGRASGTFAHPNTAVVVFSVVCILHVSAFLAHRRLSSLTLVLLYMSAALQTQSLGGLTGLGVGVCYLVWKAYGWKSSVSLFLLGISLKQVLLDLLPGLRDRVDGLSSTTGVSVASAGATTNSLDWRLYNWSLYLEFVREHAIAGNGLGSTLWLIQPTGTLVHNDPLRILVEVGLVGFLLTAGALYSLFGRLRLAELSLASGESAARALVLGLAVHSLAANVLQTWTALFLVAIYAGAVLGGKECNGLGPSNSASIRSRVVIGGRDQHVLARSAVSLEQ